MNDSNKAKACLQRIIDLFKSGNVPKALAVATIPPQKGIPSAKWSISNRILQFLSDTSDARGFRQWEQAGRNIKKGAKAFHILGPKSRIIKEIYDIPGISEKLLDVIVTAHELDPDEHIRIQAAFQENVDNAVSKTINLTEQTDINEVDKIFRYAHQMGCKGITVYRDNCRKGQVMSAVNKPPGLPLEINSPRARPRRQQLKQKQAVEACFAL